MTVLGVKLLLGGSDEMVIQLILYKVDCTAAKSATHYT